MYNVYLGIFHNYFEIKRYLADPLQYRHRPPFYTPATGPTFPSGFFNVVKKQTSQFVHKVREGGYDLASMHRLYTQSPALASNINTRAKWTISQLYHGRETHRRWMPAPPYAYKKGNKDAAGARMKNREWRMLGKFNTMTDWGKTCHSQEKWAKCAKQQTN